MRITITDHFKERVKERYDTNKDNPLWQVVDRFKVIQNNLRKKKKFYKIIKCKSNKWGIIFKLYDRDIVYYYAKFSGQFVLITFWRRISDNWRILKEAFNEICKIQEKWDL